MPQFLYQQLEQELRHQIRDGLYQPGERLPSVRTLCLRYQCSKATVLHALRRLEADRWLQARPKSGYFVLPPTLTTQKPTRIHPPTEPTSVSVAGLFRDIMRQGAAFDLLPDPAESAPSEHHIVLHRLIARNQRMQAAAITGYYDEPIGSAGLRQALVQRYRQRETALNEESICITGGCQHSLFLALMAVCRPGDTVAVESPAFYGVLQVLEQLSLNIIEIASDPETGLDIAALTESSTRWPIKACVVTPNFATPTGARMPDTSRHTLLQLAAEKAFILIEDDIYGDLGFSQEENQPLKALDHNDNVILCASFSKSLSRDLRVGWIVAPERFHDRIVQLKLITQLAASRSVQAGLTDFLAEGFYRRYLVRQRHQLCSQRDQWLQLLQSNWGSRIRFSVPQGGLALWIELPSSVDAHTHYQQLLASGVVVTPGSLFSSHGLYPNYLRLSFAPPLTANRRQAVDRLFRTLLPG